MSRRRKYRAEQTVARAAVKKGILNAYQLFLATGISISRCKKLWKGEGKMDTEDITAICNGLPCSIKDILRLEPIGAEDEAAAEGESS